MMKVVEVFESIIGEGKFMGMVAEFVRLYGCNLNCRWCDERHKTDYMEISEEELANWIRENMKASNINNLVITGGEPLLQSSSIIRLLENIPQDGLYLLDRVIIETNGILVKKLISLVDAYYPVHVVISPKKGRDEALKVFYDEIYPFGSIKFVVTDKRDKDAWTLYSIKDIVKFYNIPEQCVWLMPLTEGGVIDDRLCRKVWDYCVENGFNYSDRLHVRLGRR